MAHAKKPKPNPPPERTMDKAKSLAKMVWDPRDGLLEYIKYPERNPEGRVVEYDDEFVVIRDKYPKARYA